jgi:hypothetical protein
MQPIEEQRSQQQVAGTVKQLAGDRTHLRTLYEGLLDTLYVINRAGEAYTESKKLLARLDHEAFSPKHTSSLAE